MLAVACAGRAKYLRRAGTCPGCLARCDASVECHCSHPLSAHDCEQVASWEVVGWRWRNGEGSSCSSFFFLSFFVETVRSTEPSIPQVAKLWCYYMPPQYKHYCNYVYTQCVYCTVRAQHNSVRTPPGYGIGGGEAQRLSCSTDWPPFPGKAISAA